MAKSGLGIASTSGIAERAKKGLWNGGWVPYGYARDPETKLLKVDSDEAYLS